MVRSYNVDSVSVCSRVKLRELAAALRYMEERGVRPKTRSEIISLCVQAVAGVVPEEEWPSLEDSILELDGRFPVATRKGAHLLTSQSTSKRREMLIAQEETWRQDGMRRKTQVGGTTIAPPEMRQKDGVMYIIHGTVEEMRGDEEKWKKQIEEGTVRVVSKEEWAEIDRAPILDLASLTRA